MSKHRDRSLIHGSDHVCGMYCDGQDHGSPCEMLTVDEDRLTKVDILKYQIAELRQTVTELSLDVAELASKRTGEQSMNVAYDKDLTAVSAAIRQVLDRGESVHLAISNNGYVVSNPVAPVETIDPRLDAFEIRSEREITGRWISDFKGAIGIRAYGETYEESRSACLRMMAAVLEAKR